MDMTSLERVVAEAVVVGLSKAHDKDGKLVQVFVPIESLATVAKATLEFLNDQGVKVEV